MDGDDSRNELQVVISNGYLKWLTAYEWTIQRLWAYEMRGMILVLFELTVPIGNESFQKKLLMLIPNPLI